MENGNDSEEATEKMMKKILLLGGSAQQVIAIETAKHLGYYTVLCDFLPNNPGQYVADTFYLVSTTDKDAVLHVANKEQVDGVLAYASDPAAPTAAYVAEKLGLPTNPYQSVNTLCNKDVFRTFLLENGFNAPCSGGYNVLREVMQEIDKYRFPVIVKPVDSSGSKGITVVYQQTELEPAVEFALSFSRSHKFIVEEFVEKKHPYLIGGDIFIQDGKIVLWGLMNCHRDNTVNELVPIGKSYPLQLEDADVQSVKDTLQRMVDKLHIKMGAMNVEVVVDKEGRVLPIDVGPRNGGNMIPDLLGLIFNVDIVEWSVKAAMNEKIQIENVSSTPYYATHNLHSNKNGIFKRIDFADDIQSYVIRTCVYKKEGDFVEFFDNAAKAIGIVFFKFDNAEQMQKYLSNVNKYIKIVFQNMELEIISESQRKQSIINQCDEAFVNPVTQRKNYKELFEKIDANATFISAYDKETMGYAAMYCNNLETREAYITLIAVKPDYQGKHIGTALLCECEKIALQKGMKSISLEVLKTNERAISFYVKLGFQNMGQKNWNSIHMMKQL